MGREHLWNQWSQHYIFFFSCFRLALNLHCILRSCLYSLHHQYWDYRCAPPCLVDAMLEKEPRALSMLDKPSPNWATPQPQHHLIHHVTFTTQSPPTNSSVSHTLKGTREVNTMCVFLLSWALLLNSLTVLFRAGQIVSSYKTRGALQSPADLLGRIFSADVRTSLTCSACFLVHFPWRSQNFQLGSAIHNLLPLFNVPSKKWIPLLALTKFSFILEVSSSKAHKGLSVVHK